jgi:elongation factor G
MPHETITTIAEAEGRFVQQMGGHGCYAVVRLRVEPLKSKKLVFVNEVGSDTILPKFIKPIEKGIKEAAKDGVLDSGFSLTGIKVTLVGGRFHDVDSDEESFKMAGGIGFRNAIDNANPILV